MSKSTNTALHDIHFELKATADTKTTTGVTDDSYVCKNGSFLKDKDNHNVKTGTNLVPSNWQDVKDKVVGNYNMYWFDLAGDTSNYCNQTYRPNCRAVYSEGATAVPTATPHVTPGIGKPLFIVPDTNHVFLFARPTTSTTSKIGGQYYMKDYVANQGNTKLYQDYAKSSPVGLATGTTSKAVRLRMENQETSSGSAVNQRERLQACSQCNPGYTLSEGKQKPKKVCKRWIKANRGGGGAATEGRNKPRRLLGKIRYNDGATPNNLTAARDHFVPFGVANNKPWYENDVSATNHKFQPYNGSSSFWGPSGVKSTYVAAFKTNSETLKDTTNLWDWFPIESHSHNVALVRAIDCKKAGTTGSDPVCNWRIHHRLGINRNAPNDDKNYVKSNLQEFKSSSNISADDIYCGYTAGNDNVADTYTHDEAQKRWRSLFFKDIYYENPPGTRWDVNNGRQLGTYSEIRTATKYYDQINNSVIWDPSKFHGCVKCPPGTSVIDKGCQRCPSGQWSNPVINQNQTCMVIQSEPTSNYSRDYGMDCGKATMSNEGNSWCGSGGKYGLRNCNASDGNSIETGSRNKHVCTTTEKTYGTSKYSILNKGGTCSVDTSERTYDASDTNTCFKCTCTNGVPAGPKRGKDSGKKSEGCDHEGQHKCQSCNTGYYLDGSKHCQLKVCNCPQGQPATKDTTVKCTQNGITRCNSCNAGYYLDQNDKQCKQCTRNKIQPISGSSATSCSWCSSGTRANSAHTACIWNQCTCKKRDSSGNLTSQIVGTAATGNRCHTNNGNICYSCNVGYYLDGSKQCQPCPNSPTPKTHTNPRQRGRQSYCNITTTIDWKNYFQGPNGCPANGAWCATPHDDYEKRNCNATDGNSITLTNAQKNAKNNHHICIQGNTAWRNANPTNDYYHGIIDGTNCSTIRGWNKKSVEPNNTCFKCTCTDGVPAGPKRGKADGEKSNGCDHEGQHKCQSCIAGYYLDGSKKCQPYGGNCTHGTLETQSNRTQNNHCASCNAGYYLDGNKQCQPCTGNTIQPNSGSSATSCTNCSPGTTANTSRTACIQNQCTCKIGGTTVGTKATGPACTSPSGNICANCYFNHYLDTNKQCQVCARTNNRPTVQYLYPQNTGGADTCLPVTDKWVTNFQSQCPSALGWCAGNHGNGYKTRNCNASDGNSIDIPSITKTRDKSNQYHVCLDPRHHSIYNSNCSVERSWKLKTENTNQTCFKCKCEHNGKVVGVPVGPKMNPSIGASGCDSEDQNKCKSCNKGYYLDKTVGSPTYKQCKQCPADTYQPVSNNTNDRNPSCISCGTGKYSPVGSTSVSACKFYCKYNKNNTPDFRITDKTNNNTEIQDGYGSSLKETDLYSNKNKYKITFVNNNKYINPKNGKVKVVCDQGDDGNIKLKNTDNSTLSIPSCVNDDTRCQTHREECSRYISKGTGYDTALSNYNSNPSPQNYYTLLTNVDKRYKICSQAKVGYFLGDQASTNLFNRKTLNVSTSGTNEWTLS